MTSNQDKRKSKDWHAGRLSVIQDIEAFRENLWKAVEKNAEGLTTSQVIRAFESITDRIYEAEIDDAYDKTDVADVDNIASLWDCLWLSEWIAKLRGIKIKQNA